MPAPAAAIPKGARVVRLGGAELGHWIDPRKKAFDQARLRLSEIAKLIRSRHHGPVLTDDGEPYVIAAGAHLPDIPALTEWAAKWVPLVNVDALLETLDPRCPFPRRRADSIGSLLRVRRTERRALGLKTIGAIDFTKEQRTSARKLKKREREANRRHAAGARPRTDSASQTKPWIAAGFRTRRTWERHGKPLRVANACPTSGS